jgi:serine/threonine protein kinase/CHASE2 domain-containing sensor protein
MGKSAIDYYEDRFLSAVFLGLGALARRSTTQEPVMPEKTSLPPTETLVAKPPLSTSSRYTKTKFGKQSQSFARIGHVFVGFWAAIAALTTASQLVPARFMERSTQTFFFNLRGAVQPPGNIVILAIDEPSLTPSLDKTDKTAPNLNWPLRRSVYADVIERLMQAGAKTVALDILFINPSTYGQADDATLSRTLQKYKGRVTLAASYDDTNIRQGDVTRFLTPFAWEPESPELIGTINFWTEPDRLFREPSSKEGKIFRLGSEFFRLKAQRQPEQAAYLNEISSQVTSFAEAALKGAGLNYAPPKGKNIFFYGPQETFAQQNPSQQVSFRDVLDPENWNTYLNQGRYFKDKIVVIGGTANSLQDYHATPFGTMPGVEIHANAIATLLADQSIAEMFPNARAQAGFVLVLVAVAGFLQSTLLSLLTSKKLQRYLQPSVVRFILAAGMVRFMLAGAIALAWGGVGYGIFLYGRMLVPVAVPVTAMLLSGVTYLVTASASEYRSKLQLLKILMQFPRSEVVQRILSEYIEFEELLQEPERAFAGKILDNRYQISKVLGSGGFGRTYVAIDTRRPGNPECVVKQLKPVGDNPNLLQLAHKLFKREAETLEMLGKHDQIPQLLAWFEEEGEFYLVQEFVVGQPLSHELSLGRRLPAANVVVMLREILHVLDFVHSNGVIHRDIKPSNIIRRDQDRKLVLIDFGAVKVSESAPEDQSAFTIGIGTKGYMPNEQSGGKPRPNSDIYAVGMIGIQALTGLFPSQLRDKEDPRTGKIAWEDKTPVNKPLADILNRMVHYDFQTRYQTAQDVLDALTELPALPPVEDMQPLPSIGLLGDLDSSYDEGETRRWSEAVGADLALGAADGQRSSLSPASPEQNLPPVTEA